MFENKNVNSMKIQIFVSGRKHNHSILPDLPVNNTYKYFIYKINYK